MISKRFLGFLIPAFIASLIYGYLQMPQQNRVTAGKDNLQQTKLKQQKAHKDDSVKDSGFPHLRSDLMERKPQPYSGVLRNLFSSSFPVEQLNDEYSTLQDAPSEIIAPVIVVPVEPPPPPPPPSPQEVARQELSLYKFVGFFKKAGKQTIFLSNSGDILLLRKGDYLGKDRKYLVLNISDTILTLHKDGVGDFSIKLNDQESLSAVSLPAPPGRQATQAVKEIELPEPSELETPPEEEPQTGEQPQTEVQLNAEED